MAALSKYDGTLASGLAGITPASSDTNQAKATTLLNAGTAPESAFSYTAIPPSQLSNGPQPTPLPIYTSPKKVATA